ncbi:hypothetical protein [Streptomyces pseudovenezuelae]|uniref:hypothetical protein n=1 Tax=Streptomyces pseudovenezuelae TaxID=67350 RepID=UPI002E81CD44|nr:hypothetical protein [Streptomyces pseudovenezuelae]WUA85825.1 hypothetical protein OHO81_00215 [Streptomyces pseudovenezuelae]WUA93941.1 hypothetical protein OHO81_44400 [Streptomyces pseudovenezuelae]
MSKRTRALAAVGLTALFTVMIPAATAQAAPAGANCDNEYRQYAGDGNVHIYYDTDCHSPIVRYGSGDDTNWGDGSGQFVWTDHDAVSSVMNTGTYSGGWDVVKFYVDANYSEAQGYSCLKRGEIYVDDLSRNTSTTGHTMDNSISSHKWVTQGACAKFMS